MPWICPEGGWEEKYEGKDTRLCEGWRFPYRSENPVSTQLLYSGGYSVLYKNFNENETPLWRVQTQKFDDNKWEWFLSTEMDLPRKLHNCKYIEDGNDIIPTHQHLGPEFAFPLWVLDAMVGRGFIKGIGMINLIETRKKMEGVSGSVTKEIEQRETKQEVQKKAKEKKAKDTVDEMKQFLDPKKELKTKKRKGDRLELKV